MKSVKKWKIESSENVYSNKWFNVKKNEAVLPTGVMIDDYYVIENKDAVMIVATDCENRIVLKEEYRLPVNLVLCELPAGAIEHKDSSPLEAAKRELLEETGYSSDNWIYLGETFDCPERCTAKLHLFWAKDAYRISNQKLDETEDLSFFIVDINDAVRQCFQNDIRVNSCVHGILKVAYLLKI